MTPEERKKIRKRIRNTQKKNLKKFAEKLGVCDDKKQAPRKKAPKKTKTLTEAQKKERERLYSKQYYKKNKEALKEKERAKREQNKSLGDDRVVFLWCKTEEEQKTLKSQFWKDYF